MSYPERTAFFLFLNLHGVKVGNLPFNRLDGLGLVNGLHMEIDENPAFRF